MEDNLIQILKRYGKISNGEKRELYAKMKRKAPSTPPPPPSIRPRALFTEPQVSRETECNRETFIEANKRIGGCIPFVVKNVSYYILGELDDEFLVRKAKTERDDIDIVQCAKNTLGKFPGLTLSDEILPDNAWDVYQLYIRDNDLRGSAYIADRLLRLANMVRQSDKQHVVITCMGGKGRSVATFILFYMQYVDTKITIDDLLKVIRKNRPVAFDGQWQGDDDRRRWRFFIDKAAMKNTLVSLYLTTNEEWFGRILQTEDDLVYVECGRVQNMPLKKRTSLSNYEMVPQITIRDVSLGREYRQQGLLTTFIEFLLNEPNIQAVQLEAVQPIWFKARLSGSPLWVLQTPPETEDFGPTYARFIVNKPFTLFYILDRL